MKRLLAILLCLVMVLSAAACTAATQTDGELTMKNIKVGFIHISDPSDGGYTYNHDKGTQKMQETLDLSKEQVINKFNIPEDASCETAINELIEEGCSIIFATSFGHGDYMLAAAKENPEVQFCHATGYYAAGSGLANYHNYFGSIFEARYLSGIAAGLKTQTNKLGYVTAMPFAECISGFTGFYLGAKSVNPDVTMDVMYTNSWNDPTKEGQVAQALIDGGADVICQHADSSAAQTTAESNGVWGVGYNSDMINAAPNAVLTSAVWDWSIFLTMAVEAVVNGKEIPVDFSGGLKDGVVDISPLNEGVVAEGTAEAIEAAKEKIISGELKVFAGPLTDVDGKVVVAEGEEFVEPQSAPSWQYILEGINVIG